MELPTMRRRLVWAFVTSLLGAVLYFASLSAVLIFVHSSLMLAVREPVASIVFYAPAVMIPGIACLALSRRWLRRTWSETAAAMTWPYFLVGAVPLAAGAAHLLVSKNPIGLMHTWFPFYAILAYGAAGPVVLGATLCLRRRMTRSSGLQAGRAAG